MSAAFDYREHYKSVRARLNTQRAVIAIQHPMVRSIVKVQRQPIDAVVLYPYAIGPAQPIGPRERDVLHLSSVVLEPLFIPALQQAQLVRGIIADVCTRHGVERCELVSECRKAKYVNARQEAMYRIKKSTGWSLPRIGQYFGGRDHTTVLWAIRRYAQKNNMPL